MKLTLCLLATAQCCIGHAAHFDFLSSALRHYHRRRRRRRAVQRRVHSYEVYEIYVRVLMCVHHVI